MILYISCCWSDISCFITQCRNCHQNMRHKVHDSHAGWELWVIMSKFQNTHDTHLQYVLRGKGSQKRWLLQLHAHQFTMRARACVCACALVYVCFSILGQQHLKNFFWHLQSKKRQRKTKRKRCSECWIFPRLNVTSGHGWCIDESRNFCVMESSIVTHVKSVWGLLCGQD